MKVVKSKEALLEFFKAEGYKPTEHKTEGQGLAL